MEFNVSHQAGIVTLIAVVGKKGVSVGTDVVCVDERLANDHRHIDADGFFAWVDIHESVFAESEVSFMKLGANEGELDVEVDLKGYGKDIISRCQWRNQMLEVKGAHGETMRLDSNRLIDAKLRRFYAMWCLREAYVKMTGEALLAPWLKKLAISGVKVPAAKENQMDNLLLNKGEVVKDFRIHFEEDLVTNVRMELSALDKHYIVGGAVRVDAGVDASGLELGEWEELDLEDDVLAYGETFP